MGLLGTLQAEFPWGLLILADSASDLQVPPFTDPDVQLSQSSDVAAIGVMHGQFGEVQVRIWDAVGADDPQRVQLGACRLSIPTGRLIVGDVGRSAAVTIELPPGDYDISVMADDFKEAEIVEVQLIPS